MDLGLKGKNVVITGGAGGGIGTQTALAFGAEGCRVAVCDMSETGLAEIKKIFDEMGYPIYVEKVDVTNAEQLKAFAGHVHDVFGRIDIWINHAGVNRVKFFHEFTEADWDFIVNINMKATFFGTQIVSEYMKRDGGGVILNTASYAGMMPYSKGVPYGATKAAILNMTRSTAGILAPYGIRVNAVVPGAVESQLTRQRFEDPVYKKNVVSRIAMQRISTADELAKCYVFLASDAASYITGTYIEASGGKYCIQDPGNPWDHKEATT